MAGKPSEGECLEARLGLIGELVRLLRTNHVDVAVLNQALLELRHRVLRTGVLVHCRDRQATIDFRMRTVNECFEFRPYLEHRGKVFFDHILDGTWLDGYDRHLVHTGLDKGGRES